MDANWWLAIILAVIASSPGVYAIIRQSRLDERKFPQLEVSEGISASKTAADVVERYSKELLGVRDELEELRAEIHSLRGQIKEKDALIEDWQHGIERLIGQVVSLGHTPVWRPKKDFQGD